MEEIRPFSWRKDEMNKINRHRYDFLCPSEKFNRLLLYKCLINRKMILFKVWNEARLLCADDCKIQELERYIF